MPSTGPQEAVGLISSTGDHGPAPGVVPDFFDKLPSLIIQFQSTPDVDNVTPRAIVTLMMADTHSETFLSHSFIFVKKKKEKKNSSRF